MMRRLVAALSILVILALAWSGGWFWLAGWVERNTGPMLQEIASRGFQVDCQNRAVVGFPFALRIACSETAVTERSSGTRAKLPGATGGASVFAPLTASVALVSPAQVESPLLEGPAELRWKDAEIGVGLGLSGPREASFDAADFFAAFSTPGIPDETVAAARSTGRFAPSADGGTDATLAFTDLALTSGGTRFPPVSGSAAAEVMVPPRALLSGRAGIQAPLSARSIEVALESGGAHLLAEGDLSLGADGVLDGAMTLRVAGAEALPAFIAALPEEWQKIANAVTAGLFIFGQPTTLDGKPATEVKMKIDRGNAIIGPIEIGLPRVPL